MIKETRILVVFMFVVVIHMIACSWVVGGTIKWSKMVGQKFRCRNHEKLRRECSSGM